VIPVCRVKKVEEFDGSLLLSLTAIEVTARLEWRPFIARLGLMSAR
jgi:hypothetical protein